MESQFNKQGYSLSPVVDGTNSPKIEITHKNGDIPLESYTLIDSHTDLEVTFKNPQNGSVCSSIHSLSERKTKQRKPKIPDGGWGWMVVLASLTVSMIADGISFSFGLLYIELLDEFSASKSVTSWIGSLFWSIPLLTGPIMSTFVDRYGCRSMTIVGGIISAGGFIISSYGRSITMMYISFGVIAGLGLGLCYVTAVVSIAYWFDKKRTLAVGLGACGTGIGTFVYAPMTQYFISEYGWRGTVLLLAGTILNMCVCGAIMREPEWLAIEEQNKTLSRIKRSNKNTSNTNSISNRSIVESNFPGVEKIQRLLKSSEEPDYILQKLITTMYTNPSEMEIYRDRFRSEMKLPTFMEKDETVPLEVLERLRANTTLYNAISENYSSLLTCRSVSEKELNQVPDTTTAIPKTIPGSPPEDNDVNEPLMNYKNVEIVPTSTSSSRRPTLKLIDSFNIIKNGGPNPRHCLKDIKLRRNSVMYRGAMLNTPKYRLRASSCPNIYRNSIITLAQNNEGKWYSEVLEILKSITDFSLLLDLHFLILNISNILLYTWFVVPYFYLAEHLTREGYTESDASHVISIIGVANTVGMVSLGWAGDQPWFNINKTYIVCLVLCGISSAAMMLFTNSYILLTISAGFFGLFFSSNYAFTPALIVDIISLEKFTNAYGLILLSQGIGNLLGPPIAGFLFDLTGNWEQSFWQAGLWIVVAGVLIAIIPLTKNRKLCSKHVMNPYRIAKPPRKSLM